MLEPRSRRSKISHVQGPHRQALISRECKNLPALRNENLLPMVMTKGSIAE